MAHKTASPQPRQAEVSRPFSPEQFQKQVELFLEKLNGTTQMNGMLNYFNTICGLDIEGEDDAPRLAITIKLVLRAGMDEEHCLEDGDLTALLAKVERVEARPDLIIPCRWCLMAISASLRQAALGVTYRRSTH